MGTGVLRDGVTHVDLFSKSRAVRMAIDTHSSVHVIYVWCRLKWGHVSCDKRIAYGQLHVLTMWAQMSRRSVGKSVRTVACGAHVHAM